MTNLTLVSFICSFLWLFSFVLLYLDNFKLSSNKIFKYIQVSSLILTPVYLIYSLIDTIHIVNYIKDTKVNIEIGKEAAIEISKGISTLGTNIGLGATVAGVFTAAAKGISKSSLPLYKKQVLYLLVVL
jgi:hypothetical protein